MDSDILSNELINVNMMADIKADIKFCYPKLDLVRINKMIAGMFFNKENHTVFPVINGGTLWKDSIKCNFSYKKETCPDGFIDNIEKIFIKNYKKKYKRTENAIVHISKTKTFCCGYIFDKELLMKLFITMVDPNIKIAFATLLRYIIVLDSGNNQSGIDYTSMKNVDVELCASPINRTCTYFCSMFPDIDKFYKGYCGSIFDYKLMSAHFYTANPPYEEIIMNRISKTISEQLEKTKNIKIIMTLPKYPDMELDSYKNLKKFVILEKSYDKNEYLYYNHVSRKKIPIIDTLQILLMSPPTEIIL